MEPEEDHEADPVFIDENDCEVLADLDDDAEAPPDDEDDGLDDVLEDAPAGADGGEGGEGGEAAPPVVDMAWQRLLGHTQPVYAVAVNAALGLLATGSGDDTACLWKAHSSGNATPTVMKAHTDSVSCVRFSNDNTLVATGGLDGRAALWDPNSGQLVRTLEGPGGGIEWIDWHPRGNVLLAGCEDYSAWMWNAADGSCMQVFYGHGGSVTCGAFAPDGRSIITASSDASLRIWNPKSAECQFVVQGHPFHEAPIASLCVNSAGAIAVTGAEDGSARVTNLATGKVMGSLDSHTGSVECIVLAEALSLGVTAGLDGKAIIWDLQTLSVRSGCEHGGAVNKVVWVKDSPCFLSAGEEGIVRLWDVRTGACQRTWTGHTDTILDMAVSGEIILTGSEDATARAFNLKGGDAAAAGASGSGSSAAAAAAAP